MKYIIFKHFLLKYLLNIRLIKMAFPQSLSRTTIILLMRTRPLDENMEIEMFSCFGKLNDI